MNFFKFLFSKAFWIQVVLAIVISVLLIFLTMKWLDHYTHHDQRIAVPDLSKMQLDSVSQKLSRLDLRFVVLDSVRYNPNYPKFSVIEQNPKPGHYVKENRKIYLKINPSGYPKIKMPNLLRHTKREVVPALRSMGFKIGKITYKRDIAENVILGLYVDGRKIAPGDKVMKTETIDLVLGSGDPNSDVPVSAQHHTNNSTPTKNDSIQKEMNNLQLN